MVRLAGVSGSPFLPPQPAQRITLAHEVLPMDIEDHLREARLAWEKADWVVTPRVMARVGIDAALDELNEFRRQDGGQL